MNSITLDHAGAAGAGAKQAATGKAGVGMVGVFIVRIVRAAVFFHVNMHSRRVYEVVKDQDASKFQTAQDAFDMAALWDIPPKTFLVEQIEVPPGILIIFSRPTTKEQR